MAFTEAESFRFAPELRTAVAGKRVLITGAVQGSRSRPGFRARRRSQRRAAKVGVHFHSSYVDAFDLVAALRKAGVDAFPVHADVNNLGDLWAMRNYAIEQMGGLPPNLLICNSGLTENGYAFGRALRRHPMSCPRCGVRASASTLSIASINRASCSIPRSMASSR